MVYVRKSLFVVRGRSRGGWIVCAIGLLFCGMAVVASAEDHPRWVPISHDVTAKVKPGFPGKTAGVAVDPITGDVFMVVPDQGVWKSSDQGKSFERVDEGHVTGRCETGFALDADTTGKRLMCFMIYGSSAGTPDAGKTWNQSKTTHLDFGAVDWEAGGKCLVALRHESDGQLCYSNDEAQTWTNLDRGFVAVGIFDQYTIVASRGKGLVRSEDGGKTWNQVSDVEPAGRVMRVHHGVGYWTTDRGLLVSRDRGQTWSLEGMPVSAVFGPLFGRNSGRLALHMVVVGKQGFQETIDGGKTWQVVAPLPADFHVGIVGPSYAWDPVANVFYASSMGKDTLKFERPVRTLP
jgi:BNR/Asp-box repeat